MYQDMQNSIIRNKYKRYFIRGDLLYEFPAETWLTVYRRLDMRVQCDRPDGHTSLSVSLVGQAGFDRPYLSSSRSAT